MATGAETYLDNEGKAVNVSLLYEVNKDDVIYAEGWLGIAANDGESGETIALTVDQRAYQFSVPAGLSVAKGAIVYIDITDLTGHRPDDSAYSTTAGSNKVALFKAQEAKDVNNVVIGTQMPPFAS